MRRLILACVFWLSWLAPAEGQFLVPNMTQPYGGTWYWAQPVVPLPYYGGYYGGYYGRGYAPYRSKWDRDWDRDSDWYWYHESLRHHHRH
ncbi:MAG: hypothetical protein V1755_06565 [Chloroflexota bacterium]